MSLRGIASLGAAGNMLSVTFGALAMCAAHAQCIIECDGAHMSLGLALCQSAAVDVGVVALSEVSRADVN